MADGIFDGFAGTPGQPAPEGTPRRWMPDYVCRDIQQLEHGGRMYWIGIGITAQLTGDEPGGGPLPIRTDLGKRIADLIRADCAAAADGTAVRRPDQLVLQLEWTEDGQERLELFGPWTQGDPETEDGEVAHLRAARAFIGEWRRVTGLELADGGATAIIVQDPDVWLRDREQAAAETKPPL